VFDDPGRKVVLNNIECPEVSCPAKLELHVSDGQTFSDAALILNGHHAVSTGAIFQGDSVCPCPTHQNGNLWDTKSWDIALVPGESNSLDFASCVDGDCMSLNVVIATVPVGAAPGLELNFANGDGNVNACVGEEASTIVSVTDTNGDPAVGSVVIFFFYTGEFDGKSYTETTDASGQVAFELPTPNTAGSSAFEARVVGTDSVEHGAFGDLISIECNSAPVCADAEASQTIIWPPDHKFVEISVLDVTDADSDEIKININSIYSDEATATTKGNGGINRAPDGQGVNTSTAFVRAEHSGLGNGRVYHIAFTASDGKGGSCSGIVTVGVPQKKKSTPVDEGALFDASTV
jgi:hypothetical protein